MSYSHCRDFNILALHSLAMQVSHGLCMTSPDTHPSSIIPPSKERLESKPPPPMWWVEWRRLRTDLRPASKSVNSCCIRESRFCKHRENTQQWTFNTTHRGSSHLSAFRGFLATCQLEVDGLVSTLAAAGNETRKWTAHSLFGLCSYEIPSTTLVV